MAGVSQRYGDVTALADADLVIRRGELLAIVGPSGSGKSTLLNIMGTLSRPSGGTVRIDGHDVEDLSDRELSALRAGTIGFVFQQFHLSPGVTALDSVSDGLLYGGARRAERRAAAERALRRVGLGDRLRHEPHQLSGGEKQRVAIARAVLGGPSPASGTGGEGGGGGGEGPKLLLADEPTGALDSRSGAAVLELLHDLHRAGTTVVIITHDRDIAASLPREVRLRDGHIEHDARPPGGAPSRHAAPAPPGALPPSAPSPGAPSASSAPAPQDAPHRASAGGVR
ncbi:ABC transporter ATP-binding protein [Streptomyces iconiensis]|uniref:ABC transporter ATP-binding protein n=1 Tax=Streptomyces iconiensis TaxID=1384038 RepID=A0ABT7A151_9ACTN|nr:ABC transporter ATP-binding protein [Streptomyces iconiensis]MDJ1134338.1 ABC transporter ATP-binding protein [Streptomyces iconiensis]